MKYFKKNSDTKSQFEGLDFPDNFTENLSHYFNEHFEQMYPHSMNKKSIQTYGKIFSDEILLIVTLTHDSEQLSPVSLFLSKELKSDWTNSPQKIKKIIDMMAEMAGIFFEEMLSTKNWNDYNLQWYEEKYKNETYFVKTTRENIELTLNANDLLGEDSYDGLSDDFENYLEEDEKPKHKH